MENKEYNDITLICKDCGKEFVWTSGEQAFYDEKGFTNPPARCPEDRAKRKAERNNRNDFKRNDSNSTFAYRTDK
ncbi:MAG: zinc-ribbon domain-containing protein [Bacilli bacterium]|nr:zinc-ribbon domain-containing protein [Bacilli bacterium]MDD4547335.1 zinc-ribbon domain-containing protein [Bacilli bacterium]